MTVNQKKNSKPSKPIPSKNIFLKGFVTPTSEDRTRAPMLTSALTEEDGGGVVYFEAETGK